jgi:hypothetical protein
MLTAQRVSDELKIIWDLDDGIERDPAEFAALTLVPEEDLPTQCSCCLVGERKASLVAWKALINSFQPLLEKSIKLQFICTSQKIADWLKEMGASLLGEISVEPFPKK